MFVSHAQNFEDVILWRALKHIENGFYIDIGANDPLHDSVSAAFYRAGWRGLHVEPMPEFAAKLRSARPDETVIEAGLSADGATVTLFEFAGTGLTTSNEAYARQHERAGHACRRTEVGTRTLASIFEEIGARDIHWLKLDVEGMEADILRGWGTAPARPWILVIESTMPNSPTENISDWGHIVVALGYKLAYVDGLNRFYVHSTKPDLFVKFGPGPNFFDAFTLTENSPFVSAIRENINAREAQHTRKIETLRQENAAREAELARLNQVARVLSDELAAMRQSTSWRVTAPLRAVREGMRLAASGAHAWLTLKPGSRPRRVARSSIARLSNVVRSNSPMRQLSDLLLAPFPRLRQRLKAVVAFDRTARKTTTVAQKATLPVRDGDDTFWPDDRPMTTASLPRSRMFFVYVDHTIICPVNTGVQRVTRGVAAGLVSLGENVRFVKWDAAAKQCVLINSSERQYLARWNGPAVTSNEDGIYPSPAAAAPPLDFHGIGQTHWLVVPEVTHITPHPSPVTLDLIAWARRSALMTGFVFYDAIPLRRDEFAEVAAKHSQYMQHLRLADVVWPITEYSASDLVAFWKESERAVASTMPPILPLTLPGESEFVERAKRPTTGKNTILCVGTIEPRKNQLKLIAAFNAFCRRNPRELWKLIFVGNLHPLVARDFEDLLGRTVIHAGNVTDKELSRLYEECAFTVFPSIEEGFGLPIIESLWHGKACICANFGSMAEIAAGGGCLTVDVSDELALSTAVEQLATNPALRQRLATDAVSRPLSTWSDYASAIRRHCDARSPLRHRLGPIYYWIEATRTYPKNTGIQRVTRMLARELIDAGLHVIPVKWEPEGHCFRVAAEADLEHLARWNGPAVQSWSDWVEPRGDNGNGWFLMPELPLDLSPDERKGLLDFVKSRGLRSADIFYDVIPWKMRDIYPPEFANAHRAYMQQLGSFDLILAISNYSRTELLAFNESGHAEPAGSIADKLKSVVLPGEFKQTPRARRPGAPGVGRGTITIVCVGTVEPRKNHETLIEAFHLARSRCSSPIKLVLVGGGQSIEPGLGERVRAAVISDPDISWEENADDTRLHELQRDCDFTVYPSTEEGFGLPILESLWYGKPCICADFGAMAEAAAGGGCLMVDVRSSTALAAAIARLASDTEFRERLAREAIDRPVKSWRDYGNEIAARLAEQPGEPAPIPFVLSDVAVGARVKAMRLEPRPKLSVCVTTYNRAAWLAASLKNWNRLYPVPLADVEFLVCDNTSTDTTPDVVKPYLARSDFSYHRNPSNVGMLGNLRETAHHARGMYIWILGDDDILVPGSIERVLAAIDQNAGLALVYLNYAYTRLEDARTITDFDAFVRDATPIVPPEPDRSGPIRDICARNENFFTAIYTLVFRRDHALNAYSQNTSGRPFSTMLTCIPTTYYVLHHMMNEPGVWIGSPQLVVNMNVSWMRYAPLWILERIPEVYEVAEQKGVASTEMDRWRRHTLPGVVNFFRVIYESDPLNNAAYFSPARLVRRFEHLPEFAVHLAELTAIYEKAQGKGHPAATQPIASIFPNT